MSRQQEFELTQPEDEPPQANPPVFNLPRVIVWLIAVLVAIHAGMTWLAGDQTYIQLLFEFAFIPITYSLPAEQLFSPGSRYWSPVTHGLLHGDWTHLGVNVLWLVAFGSAVAKRFGAVRFLIFMAFSTAAGALAHYLFHSDSETLVIGASGAVSACMGAAARFAFMPGRFGTDERLSKPALPLLAALSNRGILAFVGIWFLINFLFGTGWLPIAGTDVQIAWEAHMGGFVFGLLAFSAFDPVPRNASAQP